MNFEDWVVEFTAEWFRILRPLGKLSDAWAHDLVIETAKAEMESFMDDHWKEYTPAEAVREAMSVWETDNEKD